MNTSEFHTNEPFFVHHEQQCTEIVKQNPIYFNRTLVRVVSAHVMKPELIRLQKRSLDLFLVDDFEYIVYGGDAPNTVASENNMWNTKTNDEIKFVAKELGVEFRQIPSEIHYHRECIFPHTKTEKSNTNPSQNSRSSDSIQFIFRDAISFCSRNLVVILDADMILVKKISFRKLLGSHNVAAIQQGRSDNSVGGSVSLLYMFTGPLMFNMNNLPKKDLINFDWGATSVDLVGRKFSFVVDTAGFTYIWLLMSEPKVLWLDRNKNENFSILDKIWFEKVTSKYPLSKSSDFEYYANKSVLHLRNGSNWKKLNASHKSLSKHEFDAVSVFLSTQAGKSV